MEINQSQKTDYTLILSDLHWVLIRQVLFYVMQLPIGNLVLWLYSNSKQGFILAASMQTTISYTTYQIVLQFPYIMHMLL